MIWTSFDIQKARQLPLAPVLKKRGYDLKPLPGGAFILKDKYPGMIIQGHQWSWQPAKQKGNTIDFFMYLEGRPFAEIMRTLLGPDGDEGGEGGGDEDGDDSGRDESEGDASIPSSADEDELPD